VNALVNMYKDGKSFGFIANALGKAESEVLTEFNRWCDGQPFKHKHVQHNRHRGRGRGSWQRGVPEQFYSNGHHHDMEEAFYDPEAFSEDGEPLEVHFFSGGDSHHAFTGKPFMHRGGHGGGRGRGRGNRGRF
jgi:hypothetical protein